MTIPSEFKEKYKAICRNPNSRQLSRNSGPKSVLTLLWTPPFCSRPAKKLCHALSAPRKTAFSTDPRVNQELSPEASGPHHGAAGQPEGQPEGQPPHACTASGTCSGRRAPPAPAEGLTQWAGGPRTRQEASCGASNTYSDGQQRKVRNQPYQPSLAESHHQAKGCPWQEGGTAPAAPGRCQEGAGTASPPSKCQGCHLTRSEPVVKKTPFFLKWMSESRCLKCIFLLMPGSTS